MKVVLYLGAQLGKQSRLYYSHCLPPGFSDLWAGPSLHTPHDKSEFINQEYALKSSGTSFSIYYLWSKNSLL